MKKEVQEGDLVYVIEKSPNGNQVKSFKCATVKLAVNGPSIGVINSNIPIAVEYRDWQNNPLPDENCPIHITVTGPGQAQELVLTPTNGQAEFDFVSEVAGTFIIRATAEFPCDPAEIEVVVS